MPTVTQQPSDPHLSPGVSSGRGGMRPDDPRHGSHAGAVAHWRAGETPCGPCGLAAFREGKAARLDQARGRPRTVELGEKAWRIVCDSPRNQLAERTGILHHNLLRYEKAGPQKRVRRGTRDRIEAAGERRFWTVRGIQRRLQALTAAGWSMAEVALRTGVAVDVLKGIRRHPAPQYVTVVIGEAIASAFETLELLVAPAGRSSSWMRAEARRRGYAPALAWDDIDYDDAPQGLGADPAPLARRDVDEIVVLRLLAGDTVPASPAERVIALRRWIAGGRSEAEFCELHGWRPGRYAA